MKTLFLIVTILLAQESFAGQSKLIGSWKFQEKSLNSDLNTPECYLAILTFQENGSYIQRETSKTGKNCSTLTSDIRSLDSYSIQYEDAIRATITIRYGKPNDGWDEKANVTFIDNRHINYEFHGEMVVFEKL